MKSNSIIKSKIDDVGEIVIIQMKIFNAKIEKVNRAIEINKILEIAKIKFELISEIRHEGLGINSGHYTSKF